ncbi:NADP-dependent 3-hydroxy acid dehydrogenase YdfG [Pseudoduganella flava]|uniref:NADP-dependent 3-hydroxy acid dehydrogenase YdfG n=1 Tax=Pseudoduganella flava TaxID=871742 RepID=A0A562Q4U8_9BURK|nr:SDR family oxidoreductase [Pseudoduganella flava]QGZ41748.1 SDR family NAD(P)-dependent oxidoreductase [Pseudoduganella flava]TWI51752.1 NADP-dependent 3-hydroxy acid dehydrogenase YdfG [Pseudoduganella flava]
MEQLTILVTGAGTGIGLHTVRALALAGHTVYASMRDIDGRNAAKARELRDWGFAHGADVRAVELDVLSQASADAAVQAIVAARGRLDAVVHNAGHLVIGPTEAFTPEEITQVFDTNFLGTQRVNRAVLPVLRRQRKGLVLWVSSTTVRGGFPPFLGPYAAAKAAMDSLAVSLSYELARFGIETSIVVPGAFTAGTDHFPKAGGPADTETAAAYARYDGLMDQVGARLAELSPPEADPAAVGAEIARIVGLPHGTRPFRSVVDFIDDGAAAVTEVAERVREEFAHRIGIADLLRPAPAATAAN